MKRILFIISAAVCLTVACKKEESSALSPDKQKSYIQDTAVEAVQLMDMDNWKSQANIIKGSVTIFDGVKPDQSVENWLSSIEPKDGDEVHLSAIKGAFTISEGSLSYAPSDALTLEYSINGVLPCMAQVDITDSDTKIAVSLDDSDSDVEPKKKTCLVYVPSEVDFKVTAAGEEGFRMKLGADFKLAGTEPTPYDTYGITASVVSGEYSINVSRAYYSPTEIAWAASFAKGSTVIFEGSVKANGNLVWETVNESYEPSLEKSSGEAEIEFSLLGKVGIRGYASLDKIKNVLSGGEPATEAEARKLVKALEKCISLSLICDGKKQASLGLELGQEGEIMPVIRFEDGSAYQLPEEYFNENSFGSVISAVSALLEKIDSLFNDKEADA